MCERNTTEHDNINFWTKQCLQIYCSREFYTRPLYCQCQRCAVQVALDVETKRQSEVFIV